MKKDIRKTDAEFEQILSKALDFEVDEARMRQRVYSRLDAPSPAQNIANALWAILVRWPATTSAVCLLAAFSIGLGLPVDIAAEDGFEVIAYAFGDPAALGASGRILPPMSLEVD